MLFQKLSYSCPRSLKGSGKSNSKPANNLLDKHNILHKSQFGLRKNKSINDAIVTNIEDIIEKLNNTTQQ